ncbi:MAG: TetR/AcrR family transcriptional regulator [Pseudomonadota bacterium]
MGRRSDHSREDLRALTLEAARGLLCAHGLEGLTARRVAAEIGYTPGTLYNIFENLDDLILHVTAGALDGLGQRVIAARQGAENPKAALIAMAGAYIEEVRAEPKLWDAVFEHRRRGGQPLPDWFEARIAQLFDLIEAELHPLFAESDAEAARRSARVLWSSLHGITSLLVAQKLELIAGFSAETLVEDLIATYLAGLEARG